MWTVTFTKLLIFSRKRKEIDQISESERNEAKQICYGMLYGIGVKGENSLSYMYSGGSNTEHSNTEPIQNLNILKIGVVSEL